MINEIDDIVGTRALCGGFNTHGFIEGNENKVLSILGFDALAVDFDPITRRYLITDLSATTVDKNITLLDKAISLTA